MFTWLGVFIRKELPGINNMMFRRNKIPALHLSILWEMRPHPGSECLQAQSKRRCSMQDPNEKHSSHNSHGVASGIHICKIQLVSHQLPYLGPPITLYKWGKRGSDGLSSCRGGIHRLLKKEMRTCIWVCLHSFPDDGTKNSVVPIKGIRDEHPKFYWAINARWTVQHVVLLKGICRFLFSRASWENKYFSTVVKSLSSLEMSPCLFHNSNS